MNKEFTIKIEWCWEDIQSIRPRWGEKRCRRTLERIGRDLRDLSIESGWKIMRHLLEDL